MSKLGFIQLRGAGDALICLPIAKYFYNQGHEIYWVIDNIFFEAFSKVAPYVNFIPLQVEEKSIQSNIRNPYWFETPRRMLLDAGVDEVISFPYEEIKHFDKIGMPERIIDPVPIRAKNLGLPFHTTFDQFKYAACSVPFSEKWNLDIRRDLKAEQNLFESLMWGSSDPYVITHLEGAMGRIRYEVDLSDFFNKIGLSKAKIIPITNKTNNIFDWITAIERCSCFVGLDSFFVNLIDQLKIDIPKYFIRRSPTHFTPVLAGKWDYLPIKLATDTPHELQF